MRLKKGDLVEVFNEKGVSSGTWSCAEIISENGHAYSVRHCSFPIARDKAVEILPRKAIRPRPPPSGEGPNVWVAGDIAEVYHNFAWKQAKVLKVIGQDDCITKILGSPLDVMVCQSDMRKVQAWQDDKWVVLGKPPEISSSSSRKRQISTGIKSDIAKTNDLLPEVLPNRRLKRTLPIESSDSKAHKVSVQKRKVTEKDVSGLPLLAKIKKMDLPQELHKIGLNLPCLLGNKVSAGDVGLRKYNRIPRTSNHIQMDSCASSVGSTGSTDCFSKVSNTFIARCGKSVECEDYCSDAESSTRQEHKGVCSCSNEGVGSCSNKGVRSCSNEELFARYHSPWHLIGGTYGYFQLL